MTRVDVLPARVNWFSNMQSILSGVKTLAPIYPDSFAAEISMFGTYRRWILGGSALCVWEKDLRPRVQELIRENEGEIYKKHKLRGATTCHCWMLCSNQHSAKPTVVIAHGERRILKRTMRVIDKHEILQKQGFELTGCPNCDLQLLTAASSAQITQYITRGSSNLPLSLCGAEVAVGDPPQYATLGGILAVAEELCAITVAHVFTEEAQVQTRNEVSDSDLILYDMNWANSSSEDCSSEDDSSEGDPSDEDDTAEPDVSQSTKLNIGKTTGLPPFDHSNQEYAIQMGEFPLSRLSSESPFRNTNDNQYDDMDWALLTIPGPWYHCVNGARRTETSFVRFEKIREDGPSGPVLIITRKGIVNGVGAGTASSIKLKGSINYRNIWSVQSDHPLDMGDSGSWVVDATTGDLYGVIVAASTVMEEGYLIPASEIMKDIQRAAGVPTVELPKRSAFSLTPQHLTDFEDIESLFGAALSLQRHGNNQDAERIHRQLLLLTEKMLGQEHPDTLTTLHGLAQSVLCQGKYEEAEDIHRRLLASEERILGKEHPRAIMVMGNLAFVLIARAKYEEAEEIQRQQLALSESVLGNENLDTLLSMEYLAIALIHRDKLEEGEALFRQALAAREALQGQEHPDTLKSVIRLASLLHQTKRYEDAEVFYRRACAGFRKTLGDDHRTTKTCLQQYVLMLKDRKAGDI